MATSEENDKDSVSNPNCQMMKSNIDDALHHADEILEQIDVTSRTGQQVTQLKKLLTSAQEYVKANRIYSPGSASLPKG